MSGRSLVRYSFESFFDNQELRFVFREFLEKSRNLEPLLFIEQYELYIVLKSDLSRFEHAQEMLKQFFILDSAYELNITKELREKTIARLKTTSNENCPKDFFNEVYGVVFLELKHDCFPRFIKSTSFEEFVAAKAKKDPKFIERIVIPEKLEESSSSSGQTNESDDDDETTDFSSPVPSSPTPRGSSSEEAKLKEIFSAFSKSLTGVAVRDRKKGLFKTYTKVFTGYDAVAWLCSFTKSEREDGYQLLQLFLDRKWIVAANYRKEKKVVDSEKYFYRFASKKRVVVVGGGAGGIPVVRALQKEFDVTLIEKNAMYEYNIDFPNLFGNPSLINKISAPYKQLTKQAKLITKKAVAVSPEGVYVEADETTTLGAAPARELIPFDYLVLATGSRYFLPFPIDEESSKICVYPYLSSSIIDSFSKLRTAKKVIIIGGGPLGIEIAGELGAHFPQATVNLISQRNILMERHCGEAHNAAQRLLSKYSNIKILLSRRVTDIKQKTVHYRLVTGDEHVETEEHTMTADVIIVAGGYSPNTSYMEELMKDSLNAHNQIKVNEKLQVFQGERKGLFTESSPSGSITSRGAYYKNIFAIGDICSIQEEKLAANAALHADMLIKNLRKMERGKQETDLETYTPAERVQIITTGPGSALMIKGDKVLTEGAFVAKVKALFRHKALLGFK